jgi:hypothetical protein
MKKVKLTGERSIESKLSRLAYELEHDAARIRADHGEAQDRLANSLKASSSQLGNLARRMGD